MQFEPVGHFFWRVFMAATTHVHAIDVFPGVGVHDPQERPGPKVHLFNVSNCGTPFHDVVHHAHLGILFFFQALRFHVLDAKVVGVCRSITEGDLQRFMQGLKGGIGGTGERAPDWGIGDRVRAEVEFQDVVGTFAVGLVGWPVLGLTFRACEDK